jgi:threonine dehydrogenase-like Zn-dependent dehydrogenase
MSSGIVEAVGKAVRDIKVGDRVVGGGQPLQGGANSVWAAHSAFTLRPASLLLKVPDGCEMTAAALWVLPRVGLNALSMANLTEKDTVLVSGQGLIGQYFARWARNRGVKLIVIEPDKYRAALSAKYVGAPVLDPLADDLEEKIAALTDGQWPSAVVEATASKKLIGQAVKFLRRPHAKMIFLSWYPGEISFDFGVFHRNEVTAYFPMGAGEVANTGRATLAAFAAGALALGDNLSAVYEYRDAARCYERVAAGDRSLMGVVFDWRKA